MNETGSLDIVLLLIWLTALAIIFGITTASIVTILKGAGVFWRMLIKEMGVFRGRKTSPAEMIDVVIIILTAIISLVLIISTSMPSLLEQVGIGNVVPRGIGHVVASIAPVILGIVVSCVFVIASYREKKM